MVNKSEADPATKGVGESFHGHSPDGSLGDQVAYFQELNAAASYVVGPVSAEMDPVTRHNVDVILSEAGSPLAE